MSDRTKAFEDVGSLANSGLDSWAKDLLPDMGGGATAPTTSGEGTTSHSNTQTVSTGGGGGWAPESAMSEELMNHMTTLLMSFGNSPMIKGELDKIDTLIDKVTGYTEKTLKQDLENIRYKKMRLANDKLVSLYMMAAGVEGATQLYAKQSEDYSGLEGAYQQMQIDPERYYARKKVELYESLATYVGALGQTLGMEKQGLGQYLNGISNIFSVKATEGVTAMNQRLQLANLAVSQGTLALNQASFNQTKIQAMSTLGNIGFTPSEAMAYTYNLQAGTADGNKKAKAILDGVSNRQMVSK